MNESILNALLQLFAMIANVSKDGLSSRAIEIVHFYLQQHLSAQLINNYITLFEKYIVTYHPQLVKEGAASTAGIDPLNTDNIRSFCTEINKNLRQREKFIVFMRLVEFINEDEVMTDRELDFITMVARCFNLTETELHNTKSYILDPLSHDIQKDKLLVISKAPDPPVEGIHHIQKNDLDGMIIILHHASTNTFIFRYLGSSNLLLNGHYIPPERIHLLDQGSLITSPKIRPIYYSDVSNCFFRERDHEKIVFQALDIKFKFKRSDNGIHRFSFTEESGNLIGILGGSGVGKSTLLNMLNGNIQPQRGRILINGYDLYAEKEKLEGMIGFVPQDDLLIEELTVFQNLYYNAKLCFSQLSKAEVLKRINKILKDLELYESRNLKVGSPLNKFISGGQRKRLNIALELIREPSILFVDEPTSGLSSLDSEKVMLLLKEQTLKGKLVIINIHQPYSDIFKLFDRILILDKGGYPIYKGNPIDALVYFKSASKYVDATEGQCLSCGNVVPEQILQIVEAREVDEYGKLVEKRKVSPREWYHLYLKNFESEDQKKSQKSPLPPRIFSIPNPWSQFWIFITRNVLSKLSNRQYMLINFLEAPLLALIIGYFTKYVSDQSGILIYIFKENENLPAYIFMAVVVALFMGLTVSAEEIIRDQKILKRESFLHLSRPSYLHSKILILFLISAIQTFSFVLIGNTILEIKGMTFQYWIVLFSASCMANMIGLNLSSGLNSVVAIYIIIPFILVPQLLFSGVIVKFDKLHNMFRNPTYVPAIGELMTSRWAYEAIAVEQFKNNQFERNFYRFDKERKNAAYYATTLIPQIMARLDEVDRSLTIDSLRDDVASNLMLVKNEIEKLHIHEAFPLFDQIEKLEPDSYTKSVSINARNYLSNVRGYYQEKEQEATRMREKTYAQLIDSLGGVNSFYTIEKKHYNDKLAELVLNRDVRLIKEVNHELVRKEAPIYMVPISRTGRAHFYSPVKIIVNQELETLWFNVLVIWFSSILFYIILVYDVLRKLIDWSEKVKMRRKE